VVPVIIIEYLFSVQARLLISIAIGRGVLQDQPYQKKSSYDKRFPFGLDFYERVHIAFETLNRKKPKKNFEMM
jgi:hypothetical protein